MKQGKLDSLMTDSHLPESMKTITASPRRANHGGSTRPSVPP